jgi:hypothetical protein
MSGEICQQVVELECGNEVYLEALVQNEALLGMTILGLLM